ncbi:MAG: serine/threonine-protein kinase [Acidobacteriota bacterium]
MVGGLDPGQLVGQVLDSTYRVEQKLGSGAMGIVFRARHVRLRRWFAVKVLHPHLLADAKLRKRFAREAVLAGRLSHPNVVGVLDIGELDGVCFLVMDLAPGRPLSELLGRPFGRARAIELLTQLCAGLDHAHGHGLVHRDLKPDNVIVETTDAEELARIVDFGIAIAREAPAGGGRDEGRLTTGGTVLGTPHYMAPEVATGRAFDQRADLFALGVISYEMLTGCMPFDGSGVDVLHANIQHDPPAMAERVPGLVVDPALEQLTRELMARDPAARPASAAAVRSRLDRCARDSPPARERSSAIFGARALEALGSAKTVAVATLEQPASPEDDDRGE